MVMQRIGKVDLRSLGELPEGRKAALKVGSRRFIGGPCKRGHYSESFAIRYTASGCCVSCQGCESSRSRRRDTPTANDRARLAIDHAKPEYADDYWETLLD